MAKKEMCKCGSGKPHAECCGKACSCGSGKPAKDCCKKSAKKS